MDINTELILERYQEILLRYLLNDNEELIEKWNNDKKILFKNEILENFEPLLYGDWNRNYNNTKLNLNNLKNTKIKPSDIFNMIINELTIKSKPYNYNINPNWFFLFFNKFYHYNLGNNLYLDFEYDEDIKILKFKNYNKLCKVIRDETLMIIIFHSRFVLNGKIIDILNNILDKSDKNKSLFEEIFIKKCLIQKPININGSNKRYVDLAYQINENENLIIEINEYHHDPYLDRVRKKEIIINSKIKNTFINYDVTKYSIETLKDTGDLLVKSLCKILYHDENNLLKSLQIYLIDIENLDFHFVDLYINTNIIGKEYYLKDIFKILNSKKDEDFLNKIIKQHIKYGNLDKEDFKNLNHNEKDIYNYIIENKDNLILTYYGIKNIIMSMKNKDIENRNILLKNLDNVEKNYYKIITDILKNDDLEYFYEELNHYKNLNDIQNAIILQKINIDEYFTKIYNNKKYNQYIPFLIYQENNIIKKKDILSFVKKDIETRDDYIRDYKLLSLDEIKQIFIT